VKVGWNVQETGDYEGVNNAMWGGGVTIALDSRGVLFIGVVRGSSNNVRIPPLTALFTLSIQSQGYYGHFTSLTTLQGAITWQHVSLLGRPPFDTLFGSSAHQYLRSRPRVTRSVAAFPSANT
jgi:hypothetical protein